MVHRLRDIFIQAGSHLVALLGLALIVCRSLTQNKQNCNLYGQLHMCVAQFCLIGHIHTMVTGGLLVLKHSALQLGGTPREFNHDTDMTEYTIIHISLP